MEPEFRITWPDFDRYDFDRNSEPLYVAHHLFARVEGVDPVRFVDEDSARMATMRQHCPAARKRVSPRCRVLAKLVLAAIALSPRLVVGQEASQSDDRHPVTEADLRALKRVSGLALSPDGGSIAFVQEGAVWILETAPAATPRRVGVGFAPTWSPSGGTLAFYARSDDSRTLQVFTADARAGNAVQVTHLDGGVVPDRLAWSRADVLVFVAEVAWDTTAAAGDTSAPEPASAERGFPLILGPDSPDGYAFDGILVGVAAPVRAPSSSTELFVHDLTTGQTRQLTSDGVGYHSPAWSNDGETIAAASREGFHRGAFISAIYLVDHNTGESRQLTPGVPAAVDPRWSPDGRRLAYAVYSRTDLQASGVAVVDVDETDRTGDVGRVFSQPVTDFAWSPDGKSLFVTHVDGVTQPVSQVELSSGTARTVGSEGYVANSLTVSRDGDVAWTESRGDVPVVVRLLPRGASDSEQIYDPNPQLRNVAMGPQEIVRWRNAHGHERQGVLILPVGFDEGQRYPLIVSAYSQGTHLNSFGGNQGPAFGGQAHAGLGYVVFFPGPRVPWMYGGAVTPDSVGGPDGWDLTFDDVESGVDVLIERGIVDADRMAIMGFSNGGAVAAALMTHTQRYRAAISVAPANLNWLQAALHQDNVAERWIPTNTFVGIEDDVLDNPLEHLRGSPVFRLREIHTPMLLAVGDRDDSSFILPTIQIYLGLRRLGRDVTLLRYAGMPHGFFGPAAEDLNGRILAFLNRHLGISRESPR